jgi:hypothetical protein
MWIILVGFLPDNHGRSCEVHPYGCADTLIEGEGNGMGHLVCLHLVEKVHLACYFVKTIEQMVVAFVLPHTSMQAGKLHDCLMVCC